MSREAMKLALEALETSMYPQQKQLQAITALREALAEQPAQQEPVALKWQQAPVKTQWGDDMVVASVAIDKDHTLSLYCERDQAPKVDAMLAQRTWVGLTDEERDDISEDWATDVLLDIFEVIRAIEAKLREKNGWYRQHVTDGSPCWCEPEISYTNPETGASVVVHKEPQ